MMDRFVDLGLIDGINYYLAIAVNEEDNDLKAEQFKQIFYILSIITCIDKENANITQQLIGKDEESILSKIFNICRDIQKNQFNDIQLNALLSILYNLSTVDKETALLHLIKLGLIEACCHLLLPYKHNENYIMEILQILENIVNTSKRNEINQEINEEMNYKLIQGVCGKCGIDIINDVLEDHKGNTQIEVIGHKLREIILGKDQNDNIIKPQEMDQLNEIQQII
ncbi:hypothetical protein OXYTRIMIC_477 [Oxytricha trifallax]|uniref:Uncharacterized protein n=1 Tax=Oxytricha trifallax TaxID=1172189 RepID=A0A073ICH1_9SPIT|nr:hypothetical protein OXYTRIMIC_477 [Oxytricha trifallax]